MSPIRKVVTAPKAPAAVGPYSAGIQIDNLVYTAGQIPLDPENGQLVAGEIEEQTQQALTNLKNVLEAAGSSLEWVVKTTVFLQNMGDFARMNSVYAEFFQSDPPARSAVEVSALPLGALVEVEAVAAIPGK
jgi:2-iminobutanoate/2-iminopropanoate deaminase